MNDTPPELEATEPEATAQSARTEAAHRTVADGTHTGAAPARLTRVQMLDKAEDSGRDDGGTG